MLHFGQFHIRRVAGIESAVEDEEMALVNVELVSCVSVCARV